MRVRNRARAATLLPVCALIAAALGWTGCSDHGSTGDDAGVDANGDALLEATADSNVPDAPFSCPSGHTCYYVATAGNDSNTGTSPASPWKTVGKVNASTFVAGDYVVFNQGDTWHETLTVPSSGASGNPITFGAYGSGAAPLVDGAVKLTNWTVYGGAIYQATAPAFVKNLFVGGVQMTLARTPNGSLMTASAGTSTSVTSSAQTVNWTGANVRMKTSDFTFETRVATSSSGTTVNWTPPTDYAMPAGFGFYLDNKLDALDAPGEWYCSPGSNVVYFYAPGGADPNGLDVEGTTLDHGVTSNRDYVTITGLSLANQAQAAIYLSGTRQGIRLIGNDIDGQWVDGIRMDSCTGCAVDGNRIQNCNGDGIFVNAANGDEIANNRIGNIGTIYGYGRSGVDGCIGIAIESGSGSMITGNAIDRTGYGGITARGSGHTVENNVITHALLTLMDGGAIYAYGSGCAGGAWRHNIIEDVVGATLGGTTYGGNYSVGVYFDWGCHDMTADGNTIVRVGGNGIYVQYDDANITLTNNLVYDTGGPFVQIVQRLAATNAHGGMVFTGNTMYPTGGAATLFYLVQDDGTAYADWGTMDHNHYCNPYSGAAPLGVTGAPGYHGFALPGWQSFGGFGHDPNSKDMYAHFTTGVHPEQLFENKTSAPLSVDLSKATYKDLDGNVVTGPLVLAPFTSVMLIDTSL